MNHHRTAWGLLIATTIVLWSSPATAQIAIDGRYWQYNGERVLLLGGWNHGHNPFIDHDTDNDRDNQRRQQPRADRQMPWTKLASAGGNCLRCVLDPGMASGIQNMRFCAKSGEHYDLNTMTGPFWTRLDTFLKEAHKRHIIVQIEVWDRFDLIDGSWGAWPVSPWNPKNNVNYTTASSGLATSYKSFMRHPFLQGVPGHPVYEKASESRRQKYDVVRRFQRQFMDKLLSVTLRYDNVLYCMNNETHEDPAWGQYWIKLIRNTARASRKTRARRRTCSMMFTTRNALADWPISFRHRDKYDYVDISQVNSRHADETHWNKTRWIVEAAAKANPPCLVHMTKIYGNDLALDGKPWSRFKPGDSENAIEEWWRNLLAGVAGVGFTVPPQGSACTPTQRPA